MKNQGPVERRAAKRTAADTDETYPGQAAEPSHANRSEIQTRLNELEFQNRELREAQLRAESALQLYVDLYEESPVAHLVLDKDGLILRASRAAGDLLGMSSRRLVHKPFHLFVQRDTLNEYRAHCREAILTRQKVACNALLRIRDRNPVEARLEIVGTRYPEADGPVCHMAIVEIRELEDSAIAVESETVTLPQDVPAINLTAQKEARPLWTEPMIDRPQPSPDLSNSLACVKNILTLLATAVSSEHPYARYIPKAEEKLSELALGLERLRGGSATTDPTDEPVNSIPD
jgi:PAS domain S-box-containing protein